MGLDMYLNRKTYVQTYDPKTNSIVSTVKITGPGASSVNTDKVKYLIEEVGYWRKANAIHSWFVENVQGGRDECQESYVSVEQLQELLEICESIQDCPELGRGLLPTVDGLFFGDTGYDGRYAEDIEWTIGILTPLVRDEYSNFYYQSSW